MTQRISDEQLKSDLAFRSGRNAMQDAEWLSYMLDLRSARQRIAELEGAAEKTPYWAHRGMAMELERRECERIHPNYGGDRCDQSPDCITEWCMACYAKAWMKDTREAEALSPAPVVKSPDGVKCRACLVEIDRLTALLGETQTGLPLTGETQTATVIVAQENRE